MMAMIIGKLCNIMIFLQNTKFLKIQKTITLQKAGEVYFEEGNRIVLFYKDAQISGEYTKLGYFDTSEDFVSAVESNPVLEGWGNKIVVISANNK